MHDPSYDNGLYDKGLDPKDLCLDSFAKETKNNYIYKCSKREPGALQEKGPCGPHRTIMTNSRHFMAF